MAITASFDDLRNPHFAENMNAYLQLKRMGIYTEEELKEMCEKQMKTDRLEAGGE